MADPPLPFVVARPSGCCRQISQRTGRWRCSRRWRRGRSCHHGRHSQVAGGLGGDPEAPGGRALRRILSPAVQDVQVSGAGGEDLSMRPGAAISQRLRTDSCKMGASAALTPTPQLQGSGANHPQAHLSASRPPPPRLYAEEVWPSRSTQHPPRPRRPCPSWPLARPSS